MYSEGADLAGFFIDSLHGTLVFRIIGKSVHTCVCMRACVCACMRMCMRACLCLLSVQYVWYKIV